MHLTFIKLIMPYSDNFGFYNIFWLPMRAPLKKFTVLSMNIGVKNPIFALVWGSLNEFTGLFKVFMHEAKGNEWQKRVSVCTPEAPWSPSEWSEAADAFFPYSSSLFFLSSIQTPSQGFPAYFMW